MTLFLRFIFGAALAGALVLWGGLPLPVNVIVVVAAGIIALIWGDRFLLGFMSVFRYLR